MIERYISAVVHGPPGVGKTRLANTMPGPRLALDSEGGSYDLPCEIIEWDIMNEDIDAIIPELGWENAKNTTVVVDIRDWDTYRKAMDYILKGDHPFNSVILDSLTEIQTQLREKLNPQQGIGDDFERNTYGVFDQLLVHLERDVRAMRDMARPTAKKRCNSCIVTLSDTEVLPRKPLLVGALRKRMPQFVDMEIYLTVVRDGNGNKRRSGQIEGNEMAEAKCRPDKINAMYPSGIIYDPNFRKIIKALNTEENNNNG